jgi:hypothetical protein
MTDDDLRDLADAIALNAPLQRWELLANRDKRRGTNDAANMIFEFLKMVK